MRQSTGWNVVAVHNARCGQNINGLIIFFEIKKTVWCVCGTDGSAVRKFTVRYHYCGGHTNSARPRRSGDPFPLATKAASEDKTSSISKLFYS